MYTHSKEEIEAAIRKDVESMLFDLFVMRGIKANRMQANALMHSVDSYLREAQHTGMVSEFKLASASIVVSLDKAFAKKDHCGFVFKTQRLTESGTDLICWRRKLPRNRSMRRARMKAKADYIGVYHLQYSVTIAGSIYPTYFDLYKESNRCLNSKT